MDFKRFKLKKENILVILGILAVVLIGFGSTDRIGFVKEDEPVKQESYETELEEKLKNLLSSVEGVGESQVMVTLEEGYSYDYAKINKKNEDRLSDTGRDDYDRVQEKNINEESYVLVEGERGVKSPVILKRYEPKVKGVVVVCEGGGNPKTVYDVTDAVSVALALNTSKISVLNMKK